MKKIIAILFLILLLPIKSWAAAPVIYYSDLTSGPDTGGQNNLGAFVTIWGNNFGTTQGTSTVTVGGGLVNNYPTWTNSMITFQLGPSAASGNIIVTTPLGTGSSGSGPEPFTFTVRSGNIYFVNVGAATNGSGAYTSPWNTLTTMYSTVVAGDTVYFRAGTLTDGQYCYAGYSAMCAFGDGKNGTASTPYSFIGYPNETFTWRNTGAGGTSYAFRVGGNGGSQYITLSKMFFSSSGGTNGPMGNEGTGYKIVGNNIVGINVNYGIVDFSGNNIRVIGNEFHGSSSTGTNNETHSVYIDGPNNNFEVAWNYFHDNYNNGWEISNYHNGPRIGTIHDNLLINNLYTTGDGEKGILADGCTDGPPSDNPTTTETNVAYVYNNILINEGQFESGGAIQANCGTNYIWNNTIYGPGNETEGALQFEGGGIGPGGGKPVESLINNIIDLPSSTELYYSDSNGGSPYSGQTFTLITRNNYFGAGSGPSQDTSPINANPQLISPTYTTSGNWGLQLTSPDVSPAGYNTTSTVIFDFNGVLRPTPNPAIGSQENGVSSCLSNGAACSSGAQCCSGFCIASACGNPVPPPTVSNMTLKIIGKTKLLGKTTY